MRRAVLRPTAPAAPTFPRPGRGTDAPSCLYDEQEGQEGGSWEGGGGGGEGGSGGGGGGDAGEAMYGGGAERYSEWETTADMAIDTYFSFLVLLVALCGMPAGAYTRSQFRST
jgi:hypothetical protein